LLASACKEADPGDPTSDPGTSNATTGAATEASATEASATEASATEASATESPTSTPTEGTSESTTADPLCEGVTIPGIDEAACVPVPTDYQPRTNMSADDMWEACISDNGKYTQTVAEVPGSAARITQYETAAKLLWDGGVVPTKEAFTEARDAYITPEGLESRVVRREDLHYPEIPMADWDPQVASDKQCTVTGNTDKYPERCVGPHTMVPLIDGAFEAGQTGDGDPQIHAATIHATLDWFLYLSVYKETNTCATVKPADCDSAWAYYTGLEPISSGKGWSTEVLAGSKNAHERIWDGLLAVRCWRDHEKMGDMYPHKDMIDADGLAEFNLAWEQLDEALHRGFALLIRNQLVTYMDGKCGKNDAYLPAVWQYLKITGGALQREADERDAGAAGALKTLWAATDPSIEELEAGLAALDAIFPCP
jgi:hypothetical protein